jgi:THUMP domain-like
VRGVGCRPHGAATSVSAARQPLVDGGHHPGRLGFGGTSDGARVPAVAVTPRGKPAYGRRVWPSSVWQLDPHIAYLSGEQLPGRVRGFEVLQQLFFDERRLRRALSALDCGAFQILVRGVHVDPDGLRQRLALRGGSSLTVVMSETRSRTFVRVPAEPPVRRDLVCWQRSPIRLLSRDASYS